MRRRAVGTRSARFLRRDGWFTVNLVIMLACSALLIGVALLIGRVQGRARDDAWRRIADARRSHHERERALLRCEEGPRCDHCPIDDHLR